MAQLLHMRPRHLAGNPVVSTARALRRWCSATRFCARFRCISDFPIERHRRFQCDQRLAQPDVLGKTFIQLFGFRFEEPDLYRDSGCAEFGNSLP